MRACIYDRSCQCFDDCCDCKAVLNKRIADHADDIAEYENEREREEKALRDKREG